MNRLVDRNRLRIETTGIVAGIAMLVGALGVLVLIWLLARPLALLFIAIVISQALMPVVNRLEQRMPRSLAIGAVYGGSFILLGAAGWLLAPHLVAQTDNLVQRAPEIAEHTQRFFNRWNDESGGRIGELVSRGITSGSDTLVALPVTLTQSLLEVLFVVFMSIYWLAAAPRTRRFGLSLIPVDRRDDAESLLDELGQATGGYVRGVVIDAAILGTMAAVGLWVIGFEYPILGGIVSFLGELFPVLGPVIAAIPITALALIDSPSQGLIVLAFYVALEQVEGHILTPNIMRSQTDVPQVLVLFAVFAGGAVGGLIGALVAIPLTAAIRVIVFRLAVPQIRRWSGAPPHPTAQLLDEPPK